MSCEGASSDTLRMKTLGEPEGTITEVALTRLRRKKPDNFLAFTLSLLNLFNFVSIAVCFQSLIKYL